MNNFECMNIWKRAKQGIVRIEFSSTGKAEFFVEQMLACEEKPKAGKCWWEENAFGKIIAYVKRRGIVDEFKIVWEG